MSSTSGSDAVDRVHLRMGGSNPVVHAEARTFGIVLDPVLAAPGNAIFSVRHGPDNFLAVSEIGDGNMSALLQAGSGSGLAHLAIGISGAPSETLRLTADEMVVRASTATVQSNLVVRNRLVVQNGPFSATTYENLVDDFVTHSLVIPPTANALATAFVTLSNMIVSQVTTTGSQQQTPPTAAGPAATTSGAETLQMGSIAVADIAAGSLTAYTFCNLPSDFRCTFMDQPPSAFALNAAYMQLSNYVQSQLSVAVTAAQFGILPTDGDVSSVLLSDGRWQSDMWLRSTDGRDRVRYDAFTGATDFASTGFAWLLDNEDDPPASLSLSFGDDDVLLELSRGRMKVPEIAVGGSASMAGAVAIGGPVGMAGTLDVGGRVEVGEGLTVRGGDLDILDGALLVAGGVAASSFYADTYCNLPIAVAGSGNAGMVRLASATYGPGFDDDDAIAPTIAMVQGMWSDRLSNIDSRIEDAVTISTEALYVASRSLGDEHTIARSYSSNESVEAVRLTSTASASNTTLSLDLRNDVGSRLSLALRPAAGDSVASLANDAGPLIVWGGATSNEAVSILRADASAMRILSGPGGPALVPPEGALDGEVFIATASSQYAPDFWAAPEQAFSDLPDATSWISGEGMYASHSGAPTGDAARTDLPLIAVLGEWVQIALPEPKTPLAMTIRCTAPDFLPDAFVLLGLAADSGEWIQLIAREAQGSLLGKRGGAWYALHIPETSPAIKALRVVITRLAPKRFAHDPSHAYSTSVQIDLVRFLVASAGASEVVFAAGGGGGADADYAPPLSVSHSGCVGLRTATPSAALHVANALEARTIVVHDRDPGAPNDNQFRGIGNTPDALTVHVDDPTAAVRFVAGTSADTAAVIAEVRGDGTFAAERIQLGPWPRSEDDDPQAVAEGGGVLEVSHTGLLTWRRQQQQQQQQQHEEHHPSDSSLPHTIPTADSAPTGAGQGRWALEGAEVVACSGDMIAMRLVGDETTTFAIGAGGGNEVVDRYAVRLMAPSAGAPRVLGFVAHPGTSAIDIWLLATPGTPLTFSVRSSSTHAAASPSIGLTTLSSAELWRIDTAAGGEAQRLLGIAGLDLQEQTQTNTSYPLPGPMIWSAGPDALLVAVNAAHYPSAPELIIGDSVVVALQTPSHHGVDGALLAVAISREAGAGTWSATWARMMPPHIRISGSGSEGAGAFAIALSGLFAGEAGDGGAQSDAHTAWDGAWDAMQGAVATDVLLPTNIPTNIPTTPMAGAGPGAAWLVLPAGASVTSCARRVVGAGAVDCVWKQQSTPPRLFVALSRSLRPIEIEEGGSSFVAPYSGRDNLVALVFEPPTSVTPSVAGLCQCSNSGGGETAAPLLPSWTLGGGALFVHSRDPDAPLFLRRPDITREAGAASELPPAGRGVGIIGFGGSEAASWLNVVRTADIGYATLLSAIPASAMRLVGSISRHQLPPKPSPNGPWRRLVAVDDTGCERLLCLDAILGGTPVSPHAVTAFEVPLMRGMSALSFLPTLNPFATGGVFVSPSRGGGTVVTPGGPTAGAPLMLSAPDGFLELHGDRAIVVDAPDVRIDAGEVRLTGALRCDGNARFGGSGVFEDECKVRGRLSCAKDLHVDRTVTVGGRVTVEGEVHAVGGLAAPTIGNVARIVGSGTVALLGGEFAYDDARLTPRYFPSENAARYYGAPQLAEAIHADQEGATYDGSLVDCSWLYLDAIHGRNRNAGAVIRMTEEGGVDVMVRGGDSLCTRTDGAGLLVLADLGSSSSSNNMPDRPLQLTVRASAAAAGSLLSSAPADLHDSPIAGVRLEAAGSGDGGVLASSGLLSLYAGAAAGSGTCVGVLQAESGGRLELNPAGGAVLANGVPLQTVSDARLKKDVADIGPCSAILGRLRPRTYRLVRSGDEGGVFEAGLVAQEVYDAAPELRHLVSLPPDADPEAGQWGTARPVGLNYTGLIPYMLRALQEQAQLIDQLMLKQSRQS